MSQPYTQKFTKNLLQADSAAGEDFKLTEKLVQSLLKSVPSDKTGPLCHI